MSESHEITIRVRYHEVDGQGRVHHANYLNYFEWVRVEMLRAAGLSYKKFEEAGLMLVVSEMNIQYFLPAEFDDSLVVKCTVLSARGARIRHRYEVKRGEELLVRAETTIACVDRTGRVRRLPEDLQSVIKTA